MKVLNDVVALEVLASSPEPGKMFFAVPSGTKHFVTNFGHGWVTDLDRACLSEYAAAFVEELQTIDGVINVKVEPDGFTFGYKQDKEVFGPAASALQLAYGVPTVFKFPQPRYQRITHRPIRRAKILTKLLCYVKLLFK